MQNPKSVLENKIHIAQWFLDTKDYLISARCLDLIIISNKKKENYRIVDFAVSTDHRVKLKEGEKKEKRRIKYIDLAREMKK